MGATKFNNYTTEEINLAKIARSIAHPARIKIVNQLKSNHYLRGVDFEKILNLSSKCVHDHLQKLVDAKVIVRAFEPNQYRLFILEETVADFSFFIQHTDFKFTSSESEHFQWAFL